MVPFESLGAVSFAFHSNYGSIWHHLQYKVRYWWKIVIFSYPLAFDAFVRGVRIRILQYRLVWKNYNGETTTVKKL